MDVKTLIIDGEASLLSSIDGECGAFIKVGVPISPTLQSKTVTPTTEERTVTAETGYDGLSDVTVLAIPYEESPLERVFPTRLKGQGEISGALVPTWIKGTSQMLIDLYPVESGKKYLFCLGSSIGDRFDGDFFTDDISEQDSATGTDVWRETATAYAEQDYTASADGYIAVTTSDDGDFSMTSYCFELSSLTGLVS